MGRIPKECTGKIRCARCEGPHEYGKCENAVTVEENAVQHMGGVVVQRETREAHRIKMSIMCTEEGEKSRFKRCEE